jgi:hypothetical protein
MPTYQWKKNNVNVGTNSSTYSNNSWTNGDQVVCVMTSTAPCAVGSPATSNTLTMTVNPQVAAAVTISASPSGAICAGTPVMFTASPVNAGTPTYQWKKNGVFVGTNSPTYTDNSLINGDQVNCVMTSTAQ